MAIQVVTAAGGSSAALSNSVRTRYTDIYEENFFFKRLYDQFASAPQSKPMAELSHGSSVQFQFLSNMEPGTAVISEVADITPQALVDATASLTPTSRGEALQASETLFLQNFTQYPDQWAAILGENAAESVDLLALQAATQGTVVKRSAARNTLNAGTTADRLSESTFMQAAAMFQEFKPPAFVNSDGSLMRLGAVMSPMAYHDFREEASSSVVQVGLYQQAGIILNWELAEYGAFRLMVSPWAKVFGSAGADNAAVIATTLSTVVSRLATTFSVASSVNFDAYLPGWITIGTEETSDQPSTDYVDNERLWLTAFTAGGTGTGSGPNGGMRHGHDSATAVRNADSVHSVILGGPESLAKIYAAELGEFGQIVGPKMDGIVDQFITLGFKWHGAYGRIAENRLMRLEVSSSEDA